MKITKTVNISALSVALCFSVAACGALEKGKQAAEAFQQISEKVESGDYTGAAEDGADVLSDYKDKLGRAEVSCDDLEKFHEGYTAESGGSTPSDDLNSFADSIAETDPGLASEARETAEAYDQEREDCEDDAQSERQEFLNEVSIAEL